MHAAPASTAAQDEAEQTLARAFIHRWQGVAASELSTAQSFVRELCELLGVPAPQAAIEARFKGKSPWKKGLPRILQTLQALGRARREGNDWRG